MSEVKYIGAHARVYRTKGKADGYICECGAQAKEWAYVGGAPDEMLTPSGMAYSGIPDYYVAMCRRCHRLSDKAKITHCPKGHEYTEENTILDAGKRKCKTCVYARNRARPLTPEQKARKLELQRQRRVKQRGLS